MSRWEGGWFSCCHFMHHRSSAKVDAAVAAKAPAPKKPVPSGKLVPPPSKGAAAPAKAIGTKPTSLSESKKAKKSDPKGNVPTAPAAAAPPPPPSPPPPPLAPTDREGLCRVTYNHYNSFFPVDAAGRMRWQDIDEKYCLSFGEDDNGGGGFYCGALSRMWAVFGEQCVPLLSLAAVLPDCDVAVRWPHPHAAPQVLLFILLLALHM